MNAGKLLRNGKGEERENLKAGTEEKTVKEEEKTVKEEEKKVKEEEKRVRGTGKEVGREEVEKIRKIMDLVINR